MNLSDQIKKLLQGGIAKITMGTTEKGVPYVQATQEIQTGPAGDLTIVEHQRTGNDLGACFEKIADDAAHCEEMRTKIIQPKR